MGGERAQETLDNPPASVLVTCVEGDGECEGAADYRVAARVMKRRDVG